MRTILPFLFLVAPVSAYAQADSPAVTKPRLEELLEPIRKQYNLPALAAAVVNEQGLVAVAAVGVRKAGSDLRVTSNDQFHLGSDTKALTATIIGLLVEKGQLRYDQTLAQSFPDLAFPDEMKGITLAQLLTHRSGMPANWPEGWHQIPRTGSPADQRRVMLKRLVGEKLEAKPGEKFIYSNLGYTVAGAVAEKATGQTWEELLTAKLFRPLGIQTAGFGAMGMAGKIDQPWQHLADGQPVEPGPKADNPPVMGPAGIVHMSLPDWARFVADHIRGSQGQPALLKPGSYQKLNESPAADPFYTLGGWGGTLKGPRTGSLVLTHDGSNTMNYAVAWVAPERKLAVLVATNQGGKEPAKACHQAKDALIKLTLSR